MARYCVSIMLKQRNYGVNIAQIVLLEDFGFFNQITLMKELNHETLQCDQYLTNHKLSYCGRHVEAIILVQLKYWF